MKTAEQEKLEGNPGRRPENKKAPKPDRNIPDPPKYLDRVGVRAYHELVRIVGEEGMKVMAKSDALALSLICDAYSEYRLCRKITQTEQERYPESGGLIKRHPAITDAANAFARVMNGLKSFGMNPADRAKVNIIELLPEETPEQIKARDRAEAILKAKKAAQTKTHIKKVANE